MGKIIVDMTPFIYEDGKTYYFQICDIDSLIYYNLYVYRKEVRIKKRFLRKPIKYDHFVIMNIKPELIT